MTKRLFSVTAVTLVVFSAFFLWHSAFATAVIITPASDEVTAEANDMQVLSPGEVAVMGSQSSDASSTNEIQIGGIIIPISASGSQVIVQGKSGVTTYVSTGSQIQTYNLSELGTSTTNQTSSIDPRILRHFATGSSSLPVIIQFASVGNSDNTESVFSNSSTTAEAKLKNFKAMRAKVASALPRSSYFTKDLGIINGGAATIDQAGLAALENNPNIKSVQLDQTFHILDASSNAVMNVPPVWSLPDGSNNPLTGKGEVIAIIDSGIDYTQPDLGGCLGAGCKVIGGYNFIAGNTNIMDDYGHGTHVASIAAGQGVVNGVAPGASLIGYKVCNSAGQCPESDIIDALDYAIDPNQDSNTSDHVNVVNLSLGGSGNPDDAVSLAVDEASAAGVTVVVAAGNTGSGSSTINSPGTARTAITVAASCMPSQVNANTGGSIGECSTPIADFSSRGPLVWNGVDLSKPDISAPGILICGAQSSELAFVSSGSCIDNIHMLLSGTSMATPQVVGVAALILQLHPTYTPAQVKALLKSTATDLGVASTSEGTGLVNAYAAIGEAAPLFLSPNTWNATTTPTTRYSTSTQIFYISAVGQSVSSLTASSSFAVPGITMSFSTTTLNVSNNATATLTVNLVADNNAIEPGIYNGDVALSSGGVTEEFIPINLTVVPTISVANTSVNYGYDNPGLSSWTGSSSVVITNLRTDTSQTISVAPSNFSGAVTFTASSSITIPAGVARTLSTSITVNNNAIQNGIYSSSTIVLSNMLDSVTLSTTFTKFYVLNLVMNSSLNGDYIWINDHNSFQIQTLINTAPDSQLFYLNTAGPYDVLVTNLRGLTVMTNGVNLSSGFATVNQSFSNATNAVTTQFEDENGNPILPVFQNWDIGYNGTSLGFTAQNSNAGVATTTYFSNINSSYTYSSLYSENAYQPVNILRFYYDTFTGLTGNAIFGNSTSTLSRMNLYVNANISAPAVPALWIPLLGSNGVFFASYHMTPLSSFTLPSMQTIYSNLPANIFFNDSANIDNVSCPYTYVSCNSVFFTPYFDPGTGQRSLSNGSDTLPLSDQNNMYNGLGPTVWFGQFNNSTSTLRLASELASSAPATNVLFLRQDYSFQQYGTLNYTVSQNSATVASGNEPSFLPVYAWSADASTSAVTLPSSGQTEFTTSLPYEDNGNPLTAQVKADFNTNLTDPNPPAIKQLYFYTNGSRSEMYDPTVDDKLVYAVDPVGGVIATTSVGISTDGVTFSPLPITSSSSIYTADIPAGTILPAQSTSTILRLVATDDSGNTLTYTFGLPNVVIVINPPTLSTSTPTSITQTSATLNASITADGGASSTLRGFYWGPTSSYGATTTSSGTFGVGAFSTNLSLLTCNTTYHYAAYSVNTAGTSTTGDSVFATLPCVPTVVTQAASSVTATTSVLNGNITNLGGANVIQHGFVYGTSSNLAIVIATTTLGAQTSTSTFSQSISGLSTNTTYYVQAYAANSAGTSTGSIVSFVTGSIFMASIPTLSTSTPTSITQTSATLNAAITADGGASSTVEGFNYGLTTSYGSVAFSTGTYGTGSFSQTITGLTCATTYHADGYAVNTIGTTTTADFSFTTSACPAAATTGGGGGGGGGGGSSYIAPAPVVATSIATSSGVLSGFLVICPAPYVCTKSATASNQTVGESSYSFNQNLQIGSQGTEVTELQAFLASLGYFNQTPTGYYGAVTAAAVKAYQIAHGISPLGIVGAQTRASLNEKVANNVVAKTVVASAPIPTANPSTLSSVPFSTPLYMGVVSSDVKALQVYLNTHGYPVTLTGPGSVGNETSTFGPATKAALMKFQAAHSLPATGYFGNMTMSEIN